MNFLWFNLTVYGVVWVSCEYLNNSVESSATSSPLLPAILGSPSPITSPPPLVINDSNNRAARGATRLLEGETMGGLVGCDSFTIGNEKEKEFYSPNYPNNYTNGTICIRVISAEVKNQQVVLDFRDKFDMEPSENCKFDSLEVRDGQYGYSPFLGRYCGHEFPPLITSSGPHLWLKFFSDENIEYTGFRAVYEFVEKQSDGIRIDDDEPCFINITGLETEYITQENISEKVWQQSTKSGLDCMYMIVVDENKQVSLQWDLFSLQHPNDCEKNYVDVFGEKTDNRLSCFCGAAAETVTSKDRIMQVHLVLKKNALESKFRAHFTAYRNVPPNCTENEFNCQDGTCIAANLQCNHIVNCRTGSDEDEEDCKVELTLWEHLIDSDILIILIVFFVIMFGMCFTLIFNIVRKLIHDYNVIKEHVTQSRESQLDQLGKKTPTATILTPVLTILPNLPDSILNTGEISQHGSSCRNSLIRQECDDFHVPTEHTFPNIIQRDSYDRINGGIHYHLQQMRRESNRVYDGDVEEDGLMMREESSMAYIPEMKDNECQTRESLFQNVPSSYSSSVNKFSSKSPSPPIPTSMFPRNNLTKPINNATPSGNAPIGFTTFGYKNCQKPDDKSSSLSSKHDSMREQMFRAEAVIELDKRQIKENSSNSTDRPYSVQSTKSAPDVIVTH